MPLLSVTSCVKPFLFLGDSVSNLSFCHIICSMLFPLVGDSVQCVPFCHIICFKPFIFVADSFSSLFFLSHHMFQPPSFCSSFSFNQFLYIKELRFFYLFIYFSVNALRWDFVKVQICLFAFHSNCWNRFLNAKEMLE